MTKCCQKHWTTDLSIWSACCCWLPTRLPNKMPRASVYESGARATFVGKCLISLNRKMVSCGTTIEKFQNFTTKMMTKKIGKKDAMRWVYSSVWHQLELRHGLLIRIKMPRQILENQCLTNRMNLTSSVSPLPNVAVWHFNRPLDNNQILTLIVSNEKLENFDFEVNFTVPC